MPLSSFFWTDDVDDVMAAHMNRATASTLRGELGEAVSITTQTALTDGDFPFLKLTPNAALDVLLAPEASTNHVQVIENGSGTYTLTVKDDSDTTTIASIGPNEVAIFIPSLGTGWVALVSSDPFEVTKIPIQGGMINGKIVSSVASNNLTVAIKTLANADPSANDPVYVRIGNTVRSITAALSVTKNAGTNWCNAGSSELATKEIDYFVYLGYNATDGVVIGFSRMSFGRVYGDFSATTTNEKYAAISTITNAASTDEYENIGRFNATLSAGAGYTWSIPATSIVVSRPIHETRILDFVPQWTGLTVGNGTLTGKYQRIGMLTNAQIRLVFGSTSSISADVRVSTPTAMNHTGNQYENIGAASFLDAGTALYTGVAVAGYTSADPSLLTLRCMKVDGTYSTYAYLSSTIPMTWTTTDVIDVWCRYWN